MRLAIDIRETEETGTAGENESYASAQELPKDAAAQAAKVYYNVGIRAAGNQSLAIREGGNYR